MADEQQSAQDSGGTRTVAESDNGAVADYAWFDTRQAAEHHPELEPLTGWTWWWAGTGPTAHLVGYRSDPEVGVDLIYLDVAKRASLTRTNPQGELYLHETGELVEVLSHVLTQPDPQ